MWVGRVSVGRPWPLRREYVFLTQINSEGRGGGKGERGGRFGCRVSAGLRNNLWLFVCPDVKLYLPLHVFWWGQMESIGEGECRVNV